MGLHKNIETPQIMWELFLEYKTYIEKNPIKKHVFVGKDGSPDWELRDRPLTYEGFCNFLENKGIIQNPIHYFMNYEERYNDFVTICSRIKREIRAEQIEKGLAGIYNPSITQRLNGLTEKVESKNENINRNITIEVKDTGVPLNNNEKDIKLD